MRYIYPPCKHGRAFTLIELLAVIGIIALLAAALFPAYKTVIARGKAAKCASNLRQIGVAVASFAGDHDGAFPRGGWSASPYALGWLEDIYPYLDNRREVFVCPEGADKSPTGSVAWIGMPGGNSWDQKYPFHYAYNAQLNTTQPERRDKTPAQNVDRAAGVKRLSGLPVMVDIVFQNNFLGYDSIFSATPSATDGQVFAARHGGKGNVLWGDGSISAMTLKEWAAAPDQRVPGSSGYKKYSFCIGDY